MGRISSAGVALRVRIESEANFDVAGEASEEHHTSPKLIPSEFADLRQSFAKKCRSVGTLFRGWVVDEPQTFSVLDDRNVWLVRRRSRRLPSAFH